MRFLAAAIAIGAFTGCIGTAKAPQFSIREITTRASETEYATTIVYEVTVLARGDSASTRGPYVVLVEVRKLSGGNPESTDRSTEYGDVPVVDGIGTLAIGSDYRRKKTSISEADTWPASKYSVRIIGYIRVDRVEAVAVTN